MENEAQLVAYLIQREKYSEITWSFSAHAATTHFSVEWGRKSFEFFFLLEALKMYNIYKKFDITNNFHLHIQTL